MTFSGSCKQGVKEKEAFHALKCRCHQKPRLSTSKTFLPSLNDELGFSFFFCFLITQKMPKESKSNCQNLDLEKKKKLV